MERDSIAEYKELMSICTNAENYGKYVFLLEKCCGHRFILMFYKNNTLAEVHRTVSLDYQSPNVRLFVIPNGAQESERVYLPNDDTITLAEFINANPEYFKPVYPMPARVTYKIYYDTCSHEAHNRIREAQA
jgi:hypothetical protein